MYENSVIKKTGQWWKMLLFYFGTVCGGLMIFYGVTWMEQEGAMTWVLIGMPLFVVSFIFGIVAIRCPECKARWMWRLFHNKEHKWGLPWLLGRDDCPICKKKFHIGA